MLELADSVIHVPISQCSACRACGNDALELFLDFGAQPLATLLLKRHPDDSEYVFPKVLDRCRQCGHVQLRYSVDSNLFYSEYPRLKSVLIPAYETELAQEVAKIAIQDKGYVLEIGSGGGDFLACVAETGAKVIGVDAAHNCIQAVEDKGLQCEQGFFTIDMAKELIEKYGQPAVVVCRHVIEHVESVEGFLNGVSTLLNSTSCAYLETPDFSESAEIGDDTCFTEQHLSYFTPNSFKVALQRAGLNVWQQRVVPNMWSRSLLWKTSRSKLGNGEILECQPLTPDASEKFIRERKLLDAIIERSRNAGSLVLGGAFCRSVNMVAHSQVIDPSWFDFAVDDSVGKQGLWLPGLKISVHLFDILANDFDYLCVLGMVGYEHRIIHSKRHLLDKGVSFLKMFPPRLTHGIRLDECAVRDFRKCGCVVETLA